MRGIAEEIEGLEVVWIGFQDRKKKIMDFAMNHAIEPVGFDEGGRVAKQLNITYGAGLLMLDEDGTMVGFLDRGFSREQVLAEVRKMM